MFQLNKLAPLVKKRKRIGRGGSRGGTSGRGHKGQNARSGGGVRVGFEGGQMPLFRRLPKRGFTNARFKRDVKIINLKQLEQAFQDGDTVTKEILLEKGLVKTRSGLNGKKDFLLKVLSDGTLSKKLIIEADAVSKAAAQVIVQQGGEIRLTKEK